MSPVCEEEEEEEEEGNTAVTWTEAFETRVMLMFTSLRQVCLQDYAKT